ncbi:MAG: ADP-ribosylglycohydrolase family protein [Clostridia bacterium]|nr:ADP-ribosylglycohydrolase family protein [Clostridia bacterium]
MSTAQKEFLPSPSLSSLHPWELYSASLGIEYRQSLEEGLDVEKYADLFRAVEALPAEDIDAKEKLADTLFELVMTAPTREGYAYNEPSDLDGIRAQRVPYPVAGEISSDEGLLDRIHGAWLGRICGCMLGKTVECIRTNELIPFLKESGNYPMHRYILSTDCTEETYTKYGFPFRHACYVDKTDGMPPDDDTNYVLLAQTLIESCGRDFTPADMSGHWLRMQPKDAYCTAERVAFCNFVKGYMPPDSAVYKNACREWIGAQIRGDYFGYINPGDPENAADMAWRDASISHIKNGIYGEMWVAAMLAVAAVVQGNDPVARIETVIRGGLGEIPATSRLYEAVTTVLDGYHNGVTQSDCLAAIHARWNEHDGHDWCHTISNAMIVAASLLYGGGDYGKSICMAVETGFDTDCNGATVGSVLGMLFGRACIGDEWAGPMKDTLHTTLFGMDTVSISERAGMTMKHIKR